MNFATWNPWHGCHKVSPGCKNCYMFREKKQYGQDPDVVARSKTTFCDPLKWKEPRLIFTCSWSDWLIEEADAWREEAYDIMRRTPHHTYQILTKRIERAAGRVPVPPLPNVWLGVSVEDQKRADERIPHLLQTPAAVRFISAEPLLGPVDLEGYLGATWHCCLHCGWTPGEGMKQYLEIHGDQSLCIRCNAILPNLNLDWVIVGGESGPGARPMDIAWPRSILQQCKQAGVAAFMKQVGSKPVERDAVLADLAEDAVYDPRADAVDVAAMSAAADLPLAYNGRLLRDKKGGDPSEWPEDLRVREMPAVRV